MLKPWTPIVDPEFVEGTALAMAQATIENAIRSAEISRADVANRIGRSRSYITRMLSGDYNLTVRTFARTLAACGYQLTFRATPLTWVWSRETTTTRTRRTGASDDYGLAA